ncbi:hypothetical protein RMCBS344292_18660 [Rhizopus microsporus]|nr:hypothetical protein RMCBS344292_18660 [Rhizopus microsporus]
MATTIHNLPIEIIKEIFLQLSRHTHTHVCKYCLSSGKSPCRCWQLDLLTVALVCSHWYSIASHVIQITERIQPPWMQLLNLTDQQRSYPLRPKLINLLNESRHRSLFFHSRVRHLVIDFKTFGITEKPKLKKDDTSDVMKLLQLCPSTEQLDIIYDASFASFVTNERSRQLFSTRIASLAQCIHENNHQIRRLDLVGYNPFQRCPCCAGKCWDGYLSPLLKCLSSLHTLVLQHVLPSREVLETLATHSCLERIVLYRSIVTIPLKRLRQTDCTQQRMTTISHIPDCLWKQVKTIEIYEDIEDVTHWPAQRYMLELVEHVGNKLESFVLQFATKETNEARMLRLDQPCDNNEFNFSQSSPLLKLKIKCGESLKQISLVNVPEVLL